MEKIDFEKLRAEITTQERIYNAISTKDVGDKLVAAAQYTTLVTVQTLITEAWKSSGGSVRKKDI